MENGLTICLFMLGGLAVFSLLLQLLIIYSFVWGKNYRMKYKGADGKEITINGDTEALRQELKEEIERVLKEHHCPHHKNDKEKDKN